MQDTILQSKLELACRIAKSCFDRGMGSGTTGNLSFLHGDMIFITAGGTCFGFLTPDDFAAVPYTAFEESLSGGVTDGLAAGGSAKNEAAAGGETDPGIAPYLQRRPSKELPLHRLVYDRLARDGIREGAVIHTHATHSVLWSCVPGLDPEDCVPDHTPYLRMKMGNCGLIPYAKPGSRELFDAFSRACGDKYGWILTRHGLLTGGKDLMEAFGRSEELEESCKVAWMLRNAGLGKREL